MLGVRARFTVGQSASRMGSASCRARDIDHLSCFRGPFHPPLWPARNVGSRADYPFAFNNLTPNPPQKLDTPGYSVAENPTHGNRIPTDRQSHECAGINRPCHGRRQIPCLPQRRHTGLFSAGDFVLRDETEIYTEFCAAYEADLVPVGPVEQTFAAEIIHAAWRLRRCSTLEDSIRSKTARGPSNKPRNPSNAPAPQPSASSPAPSPNCASSRPNAAARHEAKPHRKTLQTPVPVFTKQTQSVPRRRNSGRSNTPRRPLHLRFRPEIQALLRQRRPAAPAFSRLEAPVSLTAIRGSPESCDSKLVYYCLPPPCLHTPRRCSKIDSGIRQ